MGSNRLRFLAKVSTKWGAKKSYQLMDYISDRCLPLRRNMYVILKNMFYVR